MQKACDITVLEELGSARRLLVKYDSKSEDKVTLNEGLRVE